MFKTYRTESQKRFASQKHKSQPWLIFKTKDSKTSGSGIIGLRIVATSRESDILAPKPRTMNVNKWGRGTDTCACRGAWRWHQSICYMLLSQEWRRPWPHHSVRPWCLHSSYQWPIFSGNGRDKKQRVISVRLQSFPVGGHVMLWKKFKFRSQEDPALRCMTLGLDPLSPQLINCTTSGKSFNPWNAQCFHL